MKGEEVGQSIRWYWFTILSFLSFNTSLFVYLGTRKAKLVLPYVVSQYDEREFQRALRQATLVFQASSKYHATNQGTR